MFLITCFAIPCPVGSAPMCDSQSKRLVNNLAGWYLYSVEKVVQHRGIWRLPWGSGVHQSGWWAGRIGSASSGSGHGLVGLGHGILVDAPGQEACISITLSWQPEPERCSVPECSREQWLQPIGYNDKTVQHQPTMRWDNDSFGKHLKRRKQKSPSTRWAFLW